MVSPLSINTTPVKVASINSKRKNIFFQNTGDNLIYFKKQTLSGNAQLPSTTNYDFILYPAGKNTAPDKAKPTPDGETRIAIESVASFYAISENSGSSLAVMETDYVNAVVL